MGKRKLFHSNLGTRPLGAWHQVFEFELNEAAADFELRVWAEENSQIAISTLKVIAINPLHIAKEPK